MVKYPLDPNHDDGGPKCRFLLSVGFSIGDPVTLMAALADHPRPERLTKASAVPLLHPARFVTLKPLRKLTPSSV